MSWLCMHFRAGKITISMRVRPLPSPCQWAPQPCKWTSPTRAIAGRNHQHSAPVSLSPWCNTCATTDFDAGFPPLWWSIFCCDVNHMWCLFKRKISSPCHLGKTASRTTADLVTESTSVRFQNGHQHSCHDKSTWGDDGKHCFIEPLLWRSEFTHRVLLPLCGGRPNQPVQHYTFPSYTVHNRTVSIRKRIFARSLTLQKSWHLGIHCALCRIPSLLTILYVIVFIIVLCQRWCSVDDCVVLDVEGAGLFEAILPPAAASSSTISSCPYNGNASDKPDSTEPSKVIT